MELVSVVMPLYNKSQYVLSAVESVLRQSHSCLELIIVNDGSTDDSLSLVQLVNDPRVKVFDQANKGVAATRNRGVHEANGELIAFIDADDAWYPEHLSNLLRSVSEYPMAGMFCNDYSEKLSAGRPPHRHVKFMKIHDYVGYILDGGKPVWTSALLLKKLVFLQTGGFPVGESHGEDMAVWLRSSLVAPVVFTSYCGAYYRKTKDGLASALVERPDGLMKEIDSIILEFRFPSEEVAKLLKLKNNISLAHSITAYSHRRKDIALYFINLVRDSGCGKGYKYYFLRLLGFFPSLLSWFLIKIYSGFRGRV